MAKSPTQAIAAFHDAKQFASQRRRLNSVRASLIFPPAAQLCASQMNLRQKNHAGKASPDVDFLAQQVSRLSVTEYVCVPWSYTRLDCSVCVLLP
jgi:hypothetical protein